MRSSVRVPGVLFWALFMTLLVSSSGITCERSGNTRLDSLEFEVLGVNRIAFDPMLRVYDVWLPAGATTVTVRAQTADPEARATWYVPDGAGMLASGGLGAGGGEVTVDLPPDGYSLYIGVYPPGRAVNTYIVNVNPLCPQGDPCHNGGVPGTCSGDVCVTPCMPSGPELCDGIDNDCDGAIDNGIDSPGDDLDQNCDGTLVCYVDGDDDGYGSSVSEESSYAAVDGVAEIPGACDASLIDGYADNDLDCNDTTIAASPVGIENCEDGLDNDCNGFVDLEDCVDGDLCTDDVCMAGSCANPPVSCDDGDQCTNDWCNPVDGTCENGVVLRLLCDLPDPDPCNLVGECNAAGVCAPLIICIADDDIIVNANIAVDQDLMFIATNNMLIASTVVVSTGTAADVDVVVGNSFSMLTNAQIDSSGIVNITVGVHSTIEGQILAVGNVSLLTGYDLFLAPFAGIQSTGSNIDIGASGDFTLPETSSLQALGVIDINVGRNATIAGAVSASSLQMRGLSFDNLFVVTPDNTTPFHIDGGGGASDILEYQGDGCIEFATPTSGTVQSTVGYADVTFEDMDIVTTTGGVCPI